MLWGTQVLNSTSPCRPLEKNQLINIKKPFTKTTFISIKMASWKKQYYGTLVTVNLSWKYNHIIDLNYWERQENKTKNKKRKERELITI